MVEENKGIQPVEEKAERSPYDKFVENAISEKVSRSEGLDTKKSARVAVGKDPDADPELHIFARSKEGVDSVAEAVRAPNVSIRRRYIGRNVSPEEEAEAVGPEVSKLIESTPDHVLKHGAPLVLSRVSRISGYAIDVRNGEVKPIEEIRKAHLAEGKEDTLKRLGEATKGFKFKEKKAGESEGGG